MGESHGIALTPERVENGRRDEVHHRQVLEGRLQVLPQSKLHLTIAGHSGFEPENIAKLVEATNAYKKRHK